MTRHKTILRSQSLQEKTLNSRESGVGNDKKHELTVSLTTFGKRVHDVYLTVESIMQQSLKADRIVLCISLDKFSEADIPETLRLQQNRGLEIFFCEKDLGPYTKYHYTLQKYPDSLLITVDDDILYPVDTIDRLYRSYLQYPESIHCLRGHKIMLTDRGEIAPYKQWDWSRSDTIPSKWIFPTGVGGVLYFPGCFDPEIKNETAFMELAPGADDIWLKAMSLKKGTPARILPDSRNFMQNFLEIEASQDISLKRNNKKNTEGNDAKIQRVFKHYNLLEKLI